MIPGYKTTLQKSEGGAPSALQDPRDKKLTLRVIYAEVRLNIER